MLDHETTIYLKDEDKELLDKFILNMEDYMRSVKLFDHISMLAEKRRDELETRKKLTLLDISKIGL